MSNLDSDQQDEIIPLKPKTGLKLTNKPLPKTKPSQQEFEKQADEFIAQQQENDKLAGELVLQFWTALKDSTLASEKGPVVSSLEKEIPTKLINLAFKLDNNLNDEKYGSGSHSIIFLLIRTIFFLRDKNNELDYKLSLLEKKFLAEK